MTGDTGMDADEQASASQTSMESTDVREYHVQLSETLAPLGTLDGNPTLLVNDKKGWYITRDPDESDDHPEDAPSTNEYPKERRPRNFSTDYNRVVATQLDRTLYALTSYKRPTTFEHWEPARFDEDKGQYEYATSKPTPTAKDIAAVAVWGDIDLTDDLKLQRPDLDATTYDVAEETYEAYIEAFANLYGGRDAVYMLDSVGGAYIFGAPEATLPITHYYEGDGDARARVINELIERSNDYFHAVEQRINDEIEGAREVIDPDWANNINRQYKIPLTLHGDHDAVVTPVDVENVEYRQPVAVEDVDDELRADVQEWCEEFTAVEYEKRVDDLVEALWPDEYDEHNGWASALDAWIEAEREHERREEQRRQAAAERREQRLEEVEEGLEGQPITPFLQDVYDAIDGIDTAEVVHHYASDEWDSGADMPDKTEFNPSWRTSKSGRSCYVNHETNRFGDPGDGGGGYAPKAMALGKRIITDASDDLTGEHWAEAVDALRDAGYEVPVWTPEKGSHRRDGSAYERMPFWAMRTAAVALGVLPEDGFTPKTTDDGSEYLGFPDMDTYNAALDEIETVGLDHGRDRASASGSLDEIDTIRIPTDLSEVEPAHTVRLTDDELLKKARTAANGGEFKRLWGGDNSEYGSHDEAEIALCCQLAFWTAGDPEWINRLFRESNLMHDHWDDRDTSDERSHGEEIIAKALTQTTNYYGSSGGSSSTTADTSASGTETVTEAESTTESQTGSVSGDGSGSASANASPERVEQEKSGQSSPASDGTEPPATAASTEPEPSDSSSSSIPQSPSTSVQASSARDTDTGNESETETEINSSDEAIALPPPLDDTPESNEQGGVESDDDDTACVSGNERTENDLDRTTLQKQITDTQEQLAALDTRLDEQKDLIEDLQDHLETISQRLDS